MAVRPANLLITAACLSLVNAALAVEQSIQFDTPTATQTVPPASGVDQITCTFFADMMIRQTGTDTPGPEAAVIVPVLGTGHRCSAARASGEIATQTANFSLFGRKGGYLLYGATDPNGAEGFQVINGATGKTIYKDSMIGPSLKVVDLDAGALHIAFTRGINATCSLLKDARACWAKLAAEGLIPRIISQLPPPVQACTEAYGREKVTADDPSIVTYPVDMTVSLTGKTEVRSRGAVGCAPMP